MNNGVRYFAVLSLLLFVFLSNISYGVFAQDNAVTSSPTIIITPSIATENTSTNQPATNPINLTLSPVTLYLQTDPGVPVKTEIKLRNNNTETETLKIEIGTFSAGPDGQTPVLREPTANDEFISWLVVEDTDFTLNAGEWKTIPVTFSPPSEASLSYYYSLIVSRQNVAINPGETVVEGAPAMLVLTTVNSPFAQRTLEVTSFKATYPLLEYLPQEFQVTVKNTGNVHLAPSGNIFIDAGSKKDVAILSFNPTSGSILPQSERTYTVQWKEGFPVYEVSTDKNDNGGTKLKWDFSTANTFRIGKYTANLLMVYDNG